MTQAQAIIKYLEYVRANAPFNGQDEWVYAYNIRGRSTQFGFLGHQADRTARSLAAKGLIERKLSPKGYAQYRFKYPEPKPAENHSPEPSNASLL